MLTDFGGGGKLTLVLCRGINNVEHLQRSKEKQAAGKGRKKFNQLRLLEEGWGDFEEKGNLGYDFVSLGTVSGVASAIILRHKFTLSCIIPSQSMEGARFV